jgi:uncharacterized protein YnzC (UPF0291/DUF896 family)
MEQEKILRINELAKKKKEVGLTDEETRERSALYAQYIKEFREQTEATLKRVRYDKEAETLSLYPENPKYKTMHFSGEELEEIKILGKAIAFQSVIQ